MRPRRYTPAHYSLIASFGCAVAGVLHALRHERNLRIHFAAAAYVLYFSRYYSLSRLEYCVIILFIGMVVTCEMLNTAIENTVDLETSAYNSLAKIAKDVAAGAVLVSAAASVAAGILLFWDTAVLTVILDDVGARLPHWAALLAATVLWIAFPRKRREQ